MKAIAKRAGTLTFHVYGCHPTLGEYVASIDLTTNDPFLTERSLPVLLTVTDGGAVYAPAPAALSLPTRLALHLPRPNPSGGPADLRFDLPVRSRVVLRVFDVSGLRVCTLVNGPVEAGRHVSVWQGRDDPGRAVASGVHFVRMETDGFVANRKVLRISRP